ncbi:hypothetical protein [Sphingomonas sp.]|uniref:hypothetical protein n=1 Tax=Sphingomonas sp. TaxID=28214 RepID=UPI001B0FCCA3|nr:hypothetical protein [Sphingomonas sp.]MBO9711996.1 hypothetical protein [Sphingomonas sp.]
MKKVLIVAAAGGLMMLAACTPAANNSVEATNDTEANAQVYDETANTVVDTNATVVEENTSNAM